MRIALVAFALCVACAPASGPVAHAALQPSARVQVVRVVSAPPAQGDGPSVLELAIMHGEARRTVDRAIGGVAFEDAALVLFEDRSLHRLTAEPDGVQAIDTNVDFVPVVSPDGGRFAYARSDDGLAHALIVHDASGAHLLAEGLASIGGLAFVESDRLAFVGARSGGVAGLWVARVHDGERAVCVTNCTLRTGTPWGDAFVPPPADLATLTLEANVLAWDDASGQRQSARVPAP